MPTLADFDTACAAHLQHGAMAGADPLTDSLLAQLDQAATEGALPALPYTAGLTDTQRTALHAATLDPALRWLLPAGAAATAVLSYFYPWGVA